jgi:hypothetical protein
VAAKAHVGEADVKLAERAAGAKGGALAKSSVPYSCAIA